MTSLAQNEQTNQTYRVVGAMGWREKTVASGLTKDAALAMRERMLRDPICHGASVWIEAENRTDEATIAAQKQLHQTKGRRVGEGSTQEKPASEPAPAAKAATEFDQDGRTARALRFVISDYEIREHTPGSWIVESPQGGVYLTTRETCNCPDWQHRASRVPGASCKHQIACRTLAFA